MEEACIQYFSLKSFILRIFLKYPDRIVTVVVISDIWLCGKLCEYFTDVFSREIRSAH